MLTCVCMCVCNCACTGVCTVVVCHYRSPGNGPDDAAYEANVQPPANKDPTMRTLDPLYASNDPQPAAAPTTIPTGVITKSQAGPVKVPNVRITRRLLRYGVWA